MDPILPFLQTSFVVLALVWKTKVNPLNHLLAYLTQCDLHSTRYVKDGMAMVYPWMNDVNDGSLAMDEGTTEKVSEFLSSETLCEGEPSQATLLHKSPCSSVVRAPDRR